MRQEQSDKIIRTKLDSYEASAGEVSPATWNRLSERLPKKKNKRSLIFWLSIPAAAAVLFLINKTFVQAPMPPAKAVVLHVLKSRIDSPATVRIEKTNVEKPIPVKQQKIAVSSVEVATSFSPSNLLISVPDTLIPAATAEDYTAGLPEPKPLRKVHINELYKEEREARTITAINEPPANKPKTISNAWGIIKKDNIIY